MLAKCYSAAINGVDARMVEIEVHSMLGTSQLATVGLPDTAFEEAVGFRRNDDERSSFWV